MANHQGGASRRGAGHVVALLAEGNTGEGFDSAYGVLGSVGHVSGRVAAARTDQSLARRALALSRSVIARPARGRIAGDGAEILDRAPGDAQQGARGDSQELYIAADEFLFIDENTRGILSLQRAADALTSIVHLGRFKSRGRRDVRCGASGASRRHPVQRPADDAAGCRSIFLFGAAVLQTIPGRPPGVSRRERRGLFRHQRDRPAAWACAAPTILTMRSCWSTKCCSCCRPIRRDCATA